MNRKKLLALGLAAVMAVSVAVPAFADTPEELAAAAAASVEENDDAADDETTSAVADSSSSSSKSAVVTAEEEELAAKKGTRILVSPAKVANIVDELATSALDAMEESYDSIPDDDIKTKDYTAADIYAEGADIFDELMYEIMDHLDLLSWVDSSEELTAYALHGSGARIYDNFADFGVATSFKNTDKSISASYIIGGKPRVLLNDGIPQTEEQKKSTFFQVYQMQITGAKMYAEYTYYRPENRLRVDYGSRAATTAYDGKDGSIYDMGGVDLVYRGVNSVFIQMFYPVSRTRENPEVETYFLTRVLLQKDGRVRITAKHTTMDGITRLFGGYPSWNDFKLKNAVEWEYNGPKEAFSFIAKDGAVLYPVAEVAEDTAE